MAMSNRLSAALGIQQVDLGTLTANERASLFEHLVESTKPYLQHIGKPRPLAEKVAETVRKDVSPSIASKHTVPDYPIPEETGIEFCTRVIDMVIPLKPGPGAGYGFGLYETEYLFLATDGTPIHFQLDFRLTFSRVSGSGIQIRRRVISPITVTELAEKLTAPALRKLICRLRDMAKGHVELTSERLAASQKLANQLLDIDRRFVTSR